MVPETRTIVESYKSIHVKECSLLSNNKSYCTQVSENNCCDLNSLKNCSFKTIGNYRKILQFHNQLFINTNVPTIVKTETETLLTNLV